MEETQETAYINETKRQRNSRRNKWVILHIWKERNPNQEPAKSHIHWRIGKGCKRLDNWAKVYKDVEGVEDFSFACENELVHKQVVDSARRA